MNVGPNFHERHFQGIAIAPFSVTGDQTAGLTAVAIVDPWLKAEEIHFAFLAKPSGAVTSPVLRVEVRLRSDGSTWSTLKGFDGATDVAVAASKLADAGLAETAGLGLTIPFSVIDTETYDAIRLFYGVNAGANTVTGAAVYHLGKPKSLVSQTDETFSICTGPK